MSQPCVTVTNANHIFATIALARLVIRAIVAEHFAFRSKTSASRDCEIIKYKTASFLSLSFKFVFFLSRMLDVSERHITLHAVSANICTIKSQRNVRRTHTENISADRCQLHLLSHIYFLIYTKNRAANSRERERVSFLDIL